MRDWLAGVIAVAVATSGGCKTDDPKPRPKPAETAVRSAAPAQHPRSPAAPRAAEKLGVDRVLVVEPRFEGAKPLSALRIQEQFDQARASYCMPGTDPAAIAKQMAAALARDGWDSVSSRGDALRAAVSGTNDDLRITISIGGKDATCTGLVANVLYSGTHATIPELAPGERIR
jgi:hypothetical protein